MKLEMMHWSKLGSVAWRHTKENVVAVSDLQLKGTERLLSPGCGAGPRAAVANGGERKEGTRLQRSSARTGQTLNNLVVAPGGKQKGEGKLL